MTKKKVSDKAALVEKLTGQTSVEADRTLATLFPEEPKRATVRAVNQETSRVTMDLPANVLANLQRVRELMAHVEPDGDLAKVVARLAQDYVKRHDPLLKRTSASVLLRAKQLAEGKCEYRDPVTGKICGERFQIETDHRIPRARGGTDAPENLRCLCRKHNQFMCEKILGKSLAHHWRN